MIRRSKGSFPVLALALACGLAPALMQGAAQAQVAEAVDPDRLRVCADPGNLPYSNRAGEGFENKIAALMAKELGKPLEYTWFPQSLGFVRNTLRAKKCDLIVGIGTGSELVQNSNPYYTSVFAMVYRADSGIGARSLNDRTLETLRLGAVAGTPPTTVLARNGLMSRVRPYQLMVDTRRYSAGRQMIEDLVNGVIDVAVLWGPLAGYWSKQQSVPLTVVPLLSEPGPVRMAYRVSMGMRHNETEWKRTINRLIDKLQPQINRILLDYAIPLLDSDNHLIMR